MNTTFISLEDRKKWIEKIVSLYKVERKSWVEEVSTTQYDVRNSAKSLMNFYEKQYCIVQEQKTHYDL